MISTLTPHAAERARTRGIPIDAVDAAIDYGQHRSIRGADIYTLGWRQVRFHARRGLDLSRWSGIEVVCAHNGSVLTVYRNENPRALGCQTHLRRRRRDASGRTHADFLHSHPSTPSRNSKP